MRIIRFGFGFFGGFLSDLFGLGIRHFSRIRVRGGICELAFHGHFLKSPQLGSRLLFVQLFLEDVLGRDRRDDDWLQADLVPRAQLDLMRQFGTRAHDGDGAADGPKFLHGGRESDLHELERRLPTVLDVPSSELLRAMSPAGDLSIQDDEHPTSARFHDVQNGAVPSAAEVPAALQGAGQLARHHLGVERRIGDLLHLEFRILKVEVLADPAL